MSTPLKPGDTIHNRYKISHIIGRGGMGCIYLADDRRLKGRKCAIKEVQYDLTVGRELIREARGQFRKEATVLARLDHPNLPKVSDYFSAGSRDYLVMDFVPGEDLRSKISKAKQQKKFLRIKLILGWSQQLADALIYLHSQNPPILHRDIKPSNIKVTPEGFIKLVDFGLVKILAPGEGTITIIQGQGTAFYTPLEQYGGDSAHTDVRSDIYAFGATLYHLMTNTPPIDARERFLNPESLIPLRKINQSISPQTEKVILWAMSIHPNDRPKNIIEFKDHLLGKEIEVKKSNMLFQQLWEYIHSPIEKTLLWVSLFLTVLSVIVILLH